VVVETIDRPDYPATHVYRMTEKGNLPAGFRTMLGQDLELTPLRKQQFISNLDRLGILKISSETASNIAGYDLVEGLVKAEFGDEDLSLHAGRIAVTPFGEQFLVTCVRTVT
jgi:hypothetical protein